MVITPKVTSTFIQNNVCYKSDLRYLYNSDGINAYPEDKVPEMG